MTNISMLDELIADSGISKAFIAKKLGISRGQWYKKAKGLVEFKQSEIIVLSSLLRLDDEQIKKVFFYT